jgi:hypothetical protein
MAKATHFFCMTAVKDLPYFNKPQKILRCNPVTSFQATKVSHLKLSVSLCTESSKGVNTQRQTERKERREHKMLRTLAVTNLSSWLQLVMKPVTILRTSATLPQLLA